jgi:hypothetical protein
MFKAGASASNLKELTKKEDQELKIERGELKFVGGKGGLKLSSEWVGQVDDDPVPILPRSEFRLLTELFTKAFFPGDSTIDTKRELLSDATDEYILTNGKGICNCIYYGAPLKLSRYVSGVPREVALQIRNNNAYGTIGGLLEMPDPSSANPALPLVELVLEPADTYLAGHIAYPGDHYPLRLRVQEVSGKKQRGYLQRTGVPPNPIWVSVSSDPDPARSVWYLDLYARQSIQDSPRALVNGDRMAVYGLEKSSCYMMGPSQPFGDRPFTMSLSRPFQGAYRRDLAPSPTAQYRISIRQA